MVNYKDKMWTVLYDLIWGPPYQPCNPSPYRYILVELTNAVFVSSTNLYLQIMRRQCCLS